MLGPNTATGHTSTLLYIEPEVGHAISCMQSVRTGTHRWIDVKPEVMRAYNDQLQSRLGSSVWAQCRSWYRIEGGRIVALFPGFTREYVRSLRRRIPTTIASGSSSASGDAFENQNRKKTESGDQRPLERQQTIAPVSGLPGTGVKSKRNGCTE